MEMALPHAPRRDSGNRTSPSPAARLQRCFLSSLRSVATTLPQPPSAQQQQHSPVLLSATAVAFLHALRCDGSKQRGSNNSARPLRL
ncbi:Os12g0271650 [Oryza sativa Japonica Group]|uniref:Os12g0271650 protein n=2 Tax=Oryza TaxID=4527 RepID=A0A0P0Y957_ORYSJ|nr:Os12g0271650 [Oryza sativa Japonica Group]